MMGPRTRLEFAVKMHSGLGQQRFMQTLIQNMRQIFRA